MATDVLVDVVVPLIVASIVIPLAYQWVDGVSSRIRAAKRGEQLNDNSAIEEVSRVSTAEEHGRVK